MSTVIIILCVLALAFIGQNPWILLIAIPVVGLAIWLLKAPSPKHEEHSESSLKIVLACVEEGVTFANKHPGIIIKKVDIVNSENRVQYAYMLIDEAWCKLDIEHLLKETAFDWDIIEGNDGRIWLRKIATFGAGTYIKNLKEVIKEKHPQWYVDTFSGNDLMFRIFWN